MKANVEYMLVLRCRACGRVRDLLRDWAHRPIGRRWVIDAICSECFVCQQSWKTGGP